MTNDIALRPIGHVRGGRAEAIDDNWGASRACIELDPAVFGPEALAGLDSFSHIEVIFHFDKVPPEKIEYSARHPRSRKDWPLVGIFAQRGKNRPNRLGLCTCRLIRVEGLACVVEGLDAIDGTPVLDIKPVMTSFLPRGEITEPQWVGEIMKDYW
jgi:tRNA-Thr(GGU) m(6)t(6)A37 methyltransferase TsaA